MTSTFLHQRSELFYTQVMLLVTSTITIGVQDNVFHGSKLHFHANSQITYKTQEVIISLPIH